MRVKIAEKASSKWQKMQTTLSRNCCSKNAPKLSAVIHCLQWITAKIALKMQWDFGHSGNLQNLQGNYLQCRRSRSARGLGGAKGQGGLKKFQKLDWKRSFQNWLEKNWLEKKEALIDF